MHRSGDYVIVAAIEIGKKQSGYALSFKTKERDILMNKNWYNAYSDGSYKTSTSLLVGPGNEALAFGDEAENRHKELTEDLENDSYEYSLYTNFLTDFFDQKKLRQGMTVTATNGRKAELVDIISFCFALMKMNLLDQVKQVTESNLPEDCIRWIIIVPTLCSEDAKQIVKDAAERAALNKDGHTNGLHVVEETLAVACYLHLCTVSDFVNSGLSTQTPLSKEEGFLLLHSREESFDIAHVVNNNGKLDFQVKSVVSPGSLNYVKEKFKDLLKTIFDRNFIDWYFNECPESSIVWKELLFQMNAIELFSQMSCKLSISYTFAQKYLEMTKVSLQATVERHQGSGITFLNGILILPRRAIEIIFDPILNECATVIKPQLYISSLKARPCLAFTGEIAQMVYFREKLEEKLGGKYKILVPLDAHLASMKGGVLYGHHLPPEKARSQGDNADGVFYGFFFFLFLAVVVVVLAVLIAIYK